MKRLLAPLFAILLALLTPAIAQSTVRFTGAKIRWIGDAPARVRAGQEIAGRLEIVSDQPGIVENLRLEGADWTVRSLDAPARMVLARGARRELSFRAVPADPRIPLVARFTFNGREVRKTFRFDAGSLEKAGRRGRLEFADGPPVIEKSASPRVEGVQVIRFRGRFTYLRSDFLELGADSIVVRIMDDDSPDPFDEVMWEGFTDSEGRFDVTVNWDDGADDPDIYLVATAANSHMDVHRDDLLQTTYQWSTEGFVFEDYTGNDLIFGIVRPGDTADYGAVHVYNGIIRSWRHAWQRGGMAAPPVEIFWPSEQGTFYASPDIHIQAGETWSEGTHSHEFGHHLHKIFGNLVYNDGDPAFCGDGHCIWCPESENNAFAEGFAGWFGYTVINQYAARYGITPTSINDFRYTLENLQNCQQPPNNFYPDSLTEGFIGALMRDMEDAGNDNHTATANDCDMDVMTIGDDEIYTVMRDDDPATIRAFINAFRLRYNEHDQDFWSTTRNVAVSFGFPVPPPIVTSQPEKCLVARSGESLQIHVQGNGAMLKYQWRRNGAPLFDDGVLTGTTTGTLTMSPVSDWMNGTYTCLVTTCDGTFSTLSLSGQVTILPAVTPRGLVAWGSNSSGQIGNGGSNWRTPPTVVPGVPDMVRAEGGASFTIGLRSNGTMLAWGHADYGELGNGAYYDQQNAPIPVSNLTGVVQIAAGERHSLALKRDGTIWSWGYNGYGNLGDSTETPRAVPVKAKEIEGCVKAITCGAYHSLALMADGTVMAWGNNALGTLGRGTAGGWSVQPQPVQGLTDIEAISACGYLNLALRTDGTVWAWGWNQDGCLGTGVDNLTLPYSATPVQVQGLPVTRKITAGERTGYVISNVGAAYGWGSNQYGVIGHGNQFSTRELSPVLIPGLTLPTRIVYGEGGWAAALLSTGSVWVWGYNYDWPLGRHHSPEYLWSPLQVDGVHDVQALGSAWRNVYASGDLTGVTDVGDQASLPAVLALRASPNPSLAATRIAFDLPRAGHVSLAIYDLAGRRVRSLLEGPREAGRHDATWDGRVDGASAAAAGVFFARLEAGGETLTERVVRIR